MRSSVAKALSVGIVATLSAAGLAWHECVLLAASAAAAHRLFLWRMDDGAPWDARGPAHPTGTPARISVGR